MTRLSRFLPVLTVIALLVIWEVVTRRFGIREFILPAPSVIARTAVEIAPEPASRSRC
jgi:ABC-type nitrate/sulfonate/bicarbonate transport system permease component